MPLWFIIILDIVVFYFFFGNMVEGWVLPRSLRIKGELKALRKRLRQRQQRQADLLTAKQLEEIDNWRQKITALLSSSLTEQEDFLRQFSENKQLDCLLNGPKKGRKLRENLEIIVISLALAFGVRALFIQPFKIPTGSMQPTLFGIHYEAKEPPLSENAIVKLFNYLNYSYRNVNIKAQGDGTLKEIEELPSKPLFPRSAIVQGKWRYIVPATTQDTIKALVDVHNSRSDLYFSQGDTILQGAICGGDHLFVNRLSLCFAEPKRGDIMVFVTDGLVLPDGTPFGGQYYVKRLVGLPGDELLIRDNKLYIKAPGDSDFRLADRRYNIAFERIHSCRGGYRGYAHMPGTKYLRNNNDSFKVPAGQYFMLGDNSENSLDSRYWGTVPRANLVGKPLLVWWPFSRRLGFTDRVEPLQFETPPNHVTRLQ